MAQVAAQQRGPGDRTRPGDSHVADLAAADPEDPRGVRVGADEGAADERAMRKTAPQPCGAGAGGHAALAATRRGGGDERHAAGVRERHGDRAAAVTHHRHERLLIRRGAGSRRASDLRVIPSRTRPIPRRPIRARRDRQSRLPDCGPPPAPPDGPPPPAPVPAGQTSGATRSTLKPVAPSVYQTSRRDGTITGSDMAKSLAMNPFSARGCVGAT